MVAARTTRLPLFPIGFFDVSPARRPVDAARMDFAFLPVASFSRVLMRPGSLRVVVINDQRWVVRAVYRIRQGSDPHSARLRFFNGAETRYAGEYPEDWPVLPESELTSIFHRAEPVIG
jgi:hypothetical protein